MLLISLFVVSKGILHVWFQNSWEEKIFHCSNFQLIPVCYYMRPFQEISNTCEAKSTCKYCAICIFIFLRFHICIKRFCMHSILSRPLFLYVTCDLVQIFITFNRFSVSLVKKLRNKYGKRIVLAFSYPLCKAFHSFIAESTFSHSFIAVFPFFLG